MFNIFKKYNFYKIYYAYGIIKVKYLESLLTILFVCLLFFFYDYNNKMYLILSYLKSNSCVKHFQTTVGL